MQFNQLRRREFITLLGGAVAAWPLASAAQQPEQMRRIGVLMAYAERDLEGETWVAAFREEIKKLGWAEGSNLRIDYRLGARCARRCARPCHWNDGSRSAPSRAFDTKLNYRPHGRSAPSKRTCLSWLSRRWPSIREAGTHVQWVASFGRPARRSGREHRPERTVRACGNSRR